MPVSTDQKKINDLLTRGVENIYPKKEFLESLLKSGKQLTLYTGYDPTAPTLHIGHGITMLKLRQFQELGHRVIMLIGDFTGMIGDPTDKTSARQKLTPAQVKQNYKLYKKQASVILDFTGKNKAEVKFNSKWLGKMNFADVVELTSHFTVQQMLDRDMFKKRFYGEVFCEKCDKFVIAGFKALSESGKEQNIIGPNLVNTITHCPVCSSTIDFGLEKTRIIPPKPIFLHEFLYPVMQGYDSVAMDVDGEVGGNDQTFNMLAGRDLMKDLKNKEKFVLTTKLLTDNAGKKMGKSEGNMIAFSDTPEDVFGKVMRWTDEMIGNGFELCTTVPMDEVDEMKQQMRNGANPRDFKLRLAYEVTKTFLGEKAAALGKAHFTTVIQSHDKPTDMPELKPTAYDILTVLVEAGFVKSRGEGRRDIDGGGVKINDEKVTSIDAKVKAGDIVQKGKRFFVRVK